MVGAGSAGSMLGITIEPEETTLMRVESARQAVTIEGLEQRVALLEEVVTECRRMMQLCTTPRVPSSTEIP